MMTHSCPTHGRYDITHDDCPICRKLERDSRFLGQREAVASILTLLLSKGCVPDFICYEPGPGETAPKNLKDLVAAVFGVEECTIGWTKSMGDKGQQYLGKTMFTPYSQPSEVLCDYSVLPDHDFANLFLFGLKRWDDYNGYE